MACYRDSLLAFTPAWSSANANGSCNSPVTHNIMNTFTFFHVTVLKLQLGDITKDCSRGQLNHPLVQKPKPSHEGWSVTSGVCTDKM
jgi:hypothetical protein